MTTPASGAISLKDLQTEFGGVDPIGFNEYYAGGLYVPGASGDYINVPASGTVSLDQFYNKAKLTGSALTLSSYAPGIYQGGIGPQASPGTIRNTSNVANGRYAYAACARRWTNDAYQYGGSSTTAYCWTRALAFVHPYTNITAAQANAWGFDATDVVRATGIVCVSVSATVNILAYPGYSKLAKTATSIASATGATNFYTFDDQGPSGRRGLSATMNYAIPNPDVDTLIFMHWLDSGGTNGITFNMKCTSYGTLG